MMKRNIKMIGFDLDGTLLNSNKEISDYTRDVMREAVKQGVIILPATGRPLTGIPKPVMALPGIRYAVTANGARVVDVQEDKVLHEALLPYEKGKELLEIFAKYDTYREVYYEGFGYATADMVERIEEYMPIKPMIEYMRTTRRRVPDVEAMFHEKKMAVDKLQALFRDTETRDLAMKETVFTVTGKHQAVVCNYRSVLRYEKEEIILLTFQGKLRIQGKRLRIPMYTPEEMYIEGVITEIILEG